MCYCWCCYCDQRGRKRVWEKRTMLYENFIYFLFFTLVFLSRMCIEVFRFASTSFSRSYSFLATLFGYPKWIPIFFFVGSCFLHQVNLFCIWLVFVTWSVLRQLKLCLFDRFSKNVFLLFLLLKHIVPEIYRIIIMMIPIL